MIAEGQAEELVSKHKTIIGYYKSLYLSLTHTHTQSHIPTQVAGEVCLDKRNHNRNIIDILTDELLFIDRAAIELCVCVVCVCV